ncbi:MAG: MFS transporter [Acutalibacteraceae bacterium]|nr:MFS transporter [Acutalibacteraceae bacterium]
MSSKYRSTKLACYVGYIVQAVINNFLPILFIALQDVYELSYEKLARLIVFNFVTQMVTDLITPKIVEKTGYKKAAVICHGAAALGLALLGILPRFIPPYSGIIISIIVYAFGSGLIEVLVSPIIEMLPTTDKSGNMSILHSFYCWGQAFTIIVTTFLVKVFGYGNWTIIPLVWAVLPFINMFFFMRVPVVEPEKEKKNAGFKELVRNRRFLIYMVMMLCAGATEIAMAEWASMFVQKALGVSKVVGDLTGPCAFALFMGIGRMWYAAVAKRVNFRKTLIILSTLCFICYVVVAVCNIPWVSLIFCAICGFTVSISWPGIYSAGAEEFPDGSSVMYSVFAMCGDTGCCLGPWALGIVADSFGLNTGFAVTSVFAVIMIIAVLLLGKSKA